LDLLIDHSHNCSKSLEDIIPIVYGMGNGTGVRLLAFSITDWCQFWAGRVGLEGAYPVDTLLWIIVVHIIRY